MVYNSVERVNVMFSVQGIIAMPICPPSVSYGERGMISAGHPAAAEAGAAVLQAGGNAVDAAVAGAAMLAVCCPDACGVGGDVYALIYWADSGEIAGLNGTGRSPARASAAAFSSGIPRTGIATVSVPGAVAGWSDMLARFGTISLAEAMAPAIELAAAGVTVHNGLAKSVDARAEVLKRDPVAWELFGTLGNQDTLRQPDLAETLRVIADQGPDGFYRGEAAVRIGRVSADLGGLISADDLAEHSTLWQRPISVPFAGHEVATMPPNSYGLTLLLQLQDPTAGRAGTREIGKIVAGLRSRRRAYAAGSSVIGDPEENEPRALELLERVADGEWPDGEDVIESRDLGTSNVIAMDQRGNAVSLVQSVSAPFGAGVVVPETGILLNNRMTGFTTVGGQANSVGPGLRPAHTLIPCLVLRDGAPTIAIGSPGANGQSCTLAQVLRRHLLDGEPLDAAVSLPRWSVDLRGRPIYEQDMDEPQAHALRDAVPGIAARPTGWLTFGSVKAVAKEDGVLFGVADGRREAAVAGV